MLKKCPHCGNDRNFYTTETVRRKLYFDFETLESVDASEDIGVYSGTVCRCEMCGKSIEKIDKIFDIKW